jgi:hypothetical protein
VQAEETASRVYAERQKSAPLTPVSSAYGKVCP